MPDDPMLKRSADSAFMIPYWDKADAIIDGVEQVRLNPEYLPKFPDEEDTEYMFRSRCTKMTNVFRDGAEGLAAKPFEQEVQVLEGTADAETATFIKDVDGSGNSLHSFAGDLFFNGIVNSIGWIFVDYSKPVQRSVSRATAQAIGQRPFWSHVLARNVIDVRAEMINGAETLTYFKVFEPGEPDRIREFIRNDNGVVQWALYEKQPEKVKDTETFFLRIDEGVLSINVIPMLPFITGRRNGRTWRIAPPLRDAADLQIELFQQESGLKFAKLLTAYPMLAANGIMPDKNADGTPKKLKVGPSRVLYSKPDPSTGKVGSWSYVEPNAESLKFLQADISDTIRELRELIKQPLTASSDNITVITAAVAAKKATSAVKQWALLLKMTLERALVLTALYEKRTIDPNVHVFIEFEDYSDGDDVDALNAARERGDLSQETYWDEFKRRGWLSSNFTAERERQRLLTEIPNEEEGNAP